METRAENCAKDWMHEVADDILVALSRDQRVTARDIASMVSQRNLALLSQREGERLLSESRHSEPARHRLNFILALPSIFARHGFPELLRAIILDAYAANGGKRADLLQIPAEQAAHLSETINRIHAALADGRVEPHERASIAQELEAAAADLLGWANYLRSEQ